MRIKSRLWFSIGIFWIFVSISFCIVEVIKYSSNLLAQFFFIYSNAFIFAVNLPLIIENLGD